MCMCIYIYMTQLKVLFALRIAAQFTMAFPAFRLAEGPNKTESLARAVDHYMNLGWRLGTPSCPMRLKRWERNKKKLAA